MADALPDQQIARIADGPVVDLQLRPGDLVLVSREARADPLALDGVPLKLRPLYHGPYEVTRLVGTTSVEFEALASRGSSRKERAVAPLHLVRKFVPSAEFS